MTMANLIPVVRASLHARMERLLSKPLLVRIESRGSTGPQGDAAGSPVVTLMNLIGKQFPSRESRSSNPWKEDATDGTVAVRVQVDYEREWSGDQGARAALETIKGAVDSSITCLSDYQVELLRRSPREFLASTNREAIDLVGYETDRVGRYPRVTALRLARMPNAVDAYTHLAVVPNLVQLERQLAALEVLDAPGHDDLAPLRALVGASPADGLAPTALATAKQEEAWSRTRLDEHQGDCVAKALASPHFTVIEGPPGSGKTTVIVEVLQRALTRGWRVLVASSTHVAVDNIVEKLTQTQQDDDLTPSSTPVRFASRLKAVAPIATAYWVGSKQQHRVDTIARRLEQVLSSKIHGARHLFELIDVDAAGAPPLTSALVAHKPLICGTPIGILSCDEVSQAASGSFDLLVVDEVSKMTVPEFLAVAVKAKRWCLVGDPAQMPPFCDAVDVAATLSDVLTDEVEIVCSVACGVERVKPKHRSSLDMVVVAADPVVIARAICDHAKRVQLDGMPSARPYSRTTSHAAEEGILVCAPEALPQVVDAGAASNGGKRRDRRVLVQHGVPVPSEFDSSVVKDGERAAAVLVETAYYTYHTLPWARRRNHKLPLLGLRNGIAKYMPPLADLEAAGTPGHHGALPADLVDFELPVAQRFAIHCISVYDWIAGIPHRCFVDVPVLRRLREVVPDGLEQEVRPFVGCLAKQYRMHPSLSAVPRELFYFGTSLHDGIADDRTCRVRFLQVANSAAEAGEENAAEVRAIGDMLPRLLETMPSDGSVMVITPYRAQERALRDHLAGPDQRVEVCTLDRCQGREADYVFISLVRDRATPFLDMPKRWNVALTRARKALFFVGNVDNYLREAREARAFCRSGQAVKSSLLALMLNAYDGLLEARRS